MVKASLKTKEIPEVSLVFSCYNRPDLLPMSLGSIYAQTMQDFVVLVTDNGLDARVRLKHETMVAWFANLDREAGRESRFLYYRTAGRIPVDDCYWSAEWGVNKLKELGLLGRWLTFPCDDTQYFPMHLQRMLAAAAKNLWECVLAGLPVVSPIGATRSVAGYQVWELGDICAKDTFMVRSKHFEGFKMKPSHAGPAAADCDFTHDVRMRGIPTGVLQETSMVHN